jgi:Asp-tRNA(Asn)/Glu-tRNA(Gln) amidotransferase A subunit family amidase
MVPLAFGTQTVGSVLRPAAYCGVVGLKPTHGRVSCRGIIPLAWSLDHVGFLVRSVDDAALVFGVLAGYDPEDPQSINAPVPDYSAALAATGAPPRLGFLRGFFLENASAEVAAHVEAVAATLARAGARVEEIKLPPSFEGLHAAGGTVMRAEAAAYHAPRFEKHAGEYRPRIREAIELGQAVSAVEYLAAKAHLRRFRLEADRLAQGYDALLMPVAPTPAPKGLASTGDGSFCAPWSFSGLPSITIPSCPESSLM